MAKATVKYKEIVRPIESLALTLNEKEVKTLVAILNRIGGCPDNSPRKHAGNILYAIHDAARGTGGLDSGEESALISEDIIGGARRSSIYFENYSNDNLGDHNND